MGPNCKRATRPCHCGYRGDGSGRCQCTPDQVLRYRSRVSGPLLDRIDLTIEVPAVSAETLVLAASGAAGGEDSAAVRARVIEATARQRERQRKPNARLTVSEVARHCAPTPAAQALLAQAMSRFCLSARAFHRVLKVARTIADLAGHATVDAMHVAEAIGYRQCERR